MIRRVRLRGTHLVGDVQQSIILEGERFYSISWDTVGPDNRLYRNEELERTENSYHGDSDLYHSMDRYDREAYKANNVLAGMAHSRKLNIGHQRT